MGRSVWRRYTARSAGRQMCTSCTLSHGSRSDRCGSLPRDPCVAGEERCETVELLEQSVARAADPLRLGRWLVAVVAVPIAEAPDQLVAAARGRGGGEMPPAGQLELPLRPARGPQQGLGVAWQEERRGGRRRLREQDGQEGGERVHGNASRMYTRAAGLASRAAGMLFLRPPHSGGKSRVPSSVAARRRAPVSPARWRAAQRGRPGRPL